VQSEEAPSLQLGVLPKDGEGREVRLPVLWGSEQSLQRPLHSLLSSGEGLGSQAGTPHPHSLLHCLPKAEHFLS
jgi:hypothetical protein